MTTAVAYVYTQNRPGVQKFDRPDMQHLDKKSVIETNLMFFLKNGVVPHPKVSYFLIINGETTIKDIPNVTVINRPNVGGEFAAWGDFLKDHMDYDRYIFINDTARGPFLPRWFQGHWTDAFCGMLGKMKNGKPIKMVGPTENWAIKPYPHIQTNAFAVDREALLYLVDRGLFNVTVNFNSKHGKEQVILQHEVGGSRYIIENGWEIYSFAVSQNKHPQNNDIMFYPGGYYGITPNPIEVMFVKTTCIHDGYVIRYTDWML